MRNILCNILMICTFTGSFATNEDKELSGNEVVKHTREYYKEEARNDVENQLSNLKDSDEDEDDKQTVSIYAPRSIYKQGLLSETVDELLKKNSRLNHLKHGTHMKNLPLNLRNVIIRSSDLLNSDNHDQIQQPVYQKRSTFTQAGYTQDPNTCKTYNENLVKLWSNLSKYINVTEQPNEKALHNIAIIIQAYLEHQNAKQPPEIYRVKHEERDEISKVMLKIRKMLNAGDGSAEKITNIIKKYLKPLYGNFKTEDCQEVNEEYLGSSVELLYKNYLDNAECIGDETGDYIARNKEESPSTDRHTELSLADSESTKDKPEIQTKLIGNELYNNFYNEKIPRQRQTTKYRRVFKPNWKHRSYPAIYRSEDQIENQKSKIVSKASSESAVKKLKKNSLKFDLMKGRLDRCQEYATRKLIVSLRPVIDRFIGLLECQLDNTLRSDNFDRVSKNPYYLYAPKFYSNEDSRHLRKILPMIRLLMRKKTEQSRSQTKRDDTSVENNQDILERDGETGSSCISKCSFEITDMNFASPAVIRDTVVTESNTKNNNKYNNKKYSNNAYPTIYNEYFQSPQLYDHYDGVYKTRRVTNSNEFPSLINKFIFLNDKYNTRDISNNEKSASSAFNKISNEYDVYSEESYSGEPLMMHLFSKLMLKTSTEREH